MKDTRISLYQTLTYQLELASQGKGYPFKECLQIKMDKSGYFKNIESKMTGKRKNCQNGNTDYSSGEKKKLKEMLMILLSS